LSGDAFSELPALERTRRIVVPADREHAVVALDDQCVE
jgi:hypothetical protein